MVGDGPLIQVDDEQLLATGVNPGGPMLLSVVLYGKDDELLVDIRDNEWISGDPLPWDIQADHQRLRLRSKAYDVRLQIDARRQPVTIRAKLWWKGVGVSLTGAGIRVDNTGSSLEDLALVQGGLRLSLQGGLTLRPFGDEMMIVSDPDPILRLTHAVAAFQRSKGVMVPFRDLPS